MPCGMLYFLFMEFVEARVIELPNGNNLEIEMSEEFIHRMMKQFDLTFAHQLTDDMIRLYVWGSLNAAVMKAEGEE